MQITSFEDACKKLGLDASILPEVAKLPEKNQKSIVAYYKLQVIYEAINNGWEPDWRNWDEYKYYPWYYVLSSGTGFAASHTIYSVTHSTTAVGSRLCTDRAEKAYYIAKQFEKEYADYFLFIPHHYTQ